VNVEHPESWETITMTPIRMKLNRTIRPPLFEPGENGYETYWKVSIPVKIHLNDLDMKSELLKAGAKGFVQKPYTTDEILRTLRKVLDE